MNRKRGNRLLVFVDRYRIYLLLAAVFAVMSLVAPRFLNPLNLTIIMRSTCLDATVALGFTIVLICGQLDLSIGATLTLGAMLAIGLQPVLGWWGSFLAAVAAGAGVGLINGLLVTRSRISSFIATLGTLTIVKGVIYIYCHGSSVSATGDAALARADFLERALVPLLTPRVLATAALVALAQWYLTRTRPGRNFFLVGANQETAWQSGVDPARYVTAAFVVSGVTAALGGALFALSMCSATPDLGDSSLMGVIAATIVGGTTMTGGRGSVLRSAVAVLAFAALFNGFNRLGYGSEIRVLVAGLVLALVVVHEAVAALRHDRTRGRRPVLMDELTKGSTT
jgi:ribose/xylose/arabinose/galactoside ABC-type transport system permease subunit